tara:strand:+ start:8 stop:220 length:213 start_codon:yes stop_codon:yes gene_type:complete
MIEPHPTPYTTRRGSSSLSEKQMLKAELESKNKTLVATNEGLSRRVHNLEEEVTVLFSIAGIAAISAILF